MGGSPGGIGRFCAARTRGLLASRATAALASPASSVFPPSPVFHFNVSLCSPLSPVITEKNKIIKNGNQFSRGKHDRVHTSQR